ncbi:RNA-binding protein 18-related [Anaeramoeba flamelloides]|uniref:RNA-binding protein 18-related n=1 Tax=Anaeramoeba flamelloides TaxID=1746091 RepID=A0AAV8A2N6_9EUKA|nr:RNA-binding protein 18-related [Anaeramoeba flamelloides]
MQKKYEPRSVCLTNIDLRVNEYQLLQAIKETGTITKFDYVFSKEGQNRGRFRGIAFVQYKTEEEANSAIKILNSKLLYGRRIFANKAYQRENNTKGAVSTHTRDITKGPVIQPTDQLKREQKLKSIQQKLAMMEQDRKMKEDQFNERKRKTQSGLPSNEHKDLITTSEQSAATITRPENSTTNTNPTTNTNSNNNSKSNHLKQETNEMEEPISQPLKKKREKEKRKEKKRRKEKKMKKKMLKKMKKKMKRKEKEKLKNSKKD